MRSISKTVGGIDLRPMEAARFVLVGLVNTAFSYGVYCGFLFLGAPYPVASLLAIGFGIVWSFIMSGRLVFRARLKGRFHRYLIVWAALYVANLVLIGALVTLGMNAYLGGLLALPPVVVAAYLLQKKFVFST